MSKKINFNNYTYKLIDNNISRKTPVGFCCCSLHQGYINMRILKQHECLHKGQKGYCNFLKINNKHPYIIKTLLEKEKHRDKKKIYQRIKKLYYSNEINYQTYKKYNDLIADGISIEDILDRYSK